MRLLHRVRPYAVLVHRQRHQRDAELRGDALGKRIGDRLDAAAAAGRHQCGQHRGDALPSVAGEHQLSGLRRPARAGQKLRRDLPDARGAGAGGLLQRRLQRIRPVEPFQAFRDHRRLRRQDRKVELEIDARAARLAGDPGHAAARHVAGDEGAAADLADDEAAPQQFAVDAACGGDRDVARIGELPLRRQPVARLQRAVPDAACEFIRQRNVVS